MSIAADNFAVSTPDAPAAEAVAPSRRPLAAGKLAIAFLATVLVGSALWAIADAGVSQAIDNYYAKQAAAFSVPVPELVAAINAGEADDAAATAQ